MAEELKPVEEIYKEKLDTLAKYGKFNMVAKTVDDTKRLDPRKKAERQIFLTDKKKKDKRLELKNRLKAWIELLSNHDTVGEMQKKAQEEGRKAEALLNKNIQKALEETRLLEQSYRSIVLFFKNAKHDKIRNLTILNASMDQLSDPNLDQFRAEIRNKLLWSYGKLGKSQNYSIMAIPGYIGSNMVLKEFSSMARDNKVLLLTDFHDLSSYDSVLEEFQESGFADLDKTNVVMTCNWLIGRKKDEQSDEYDDLTIPPSAALAGKLYDPNVPISQPSAGKRYGALEFVENVRFELLMEHIGLLDEQGLVPVVKDFNAVMPYSARTLSTADDVGLQTYSVVRVYDWVGKVVMDFLNQAGFENASQKMLDTYRSQIAKFLNSITGPNKLIKAFKIDKFEPDTANGRPDRILVHIIMDPLFPAKTFALKMDGTSGEGVDNYIWNTSVEQS
ncbi:MAG: hypothetical protein J5I98_03335 [Phaeodactylibacter sp.]|nr:hypothetical protein [Phaeodactylibacter sp.]